MSTSRVPSSIGGLVLSREADGAASEPNAYILPMCAVSSASAPRIQTILGGPPGTAKVVAAVLRLSTLKHHCLNYGAVNASLRRCRSGDRDTRRVNLSGMSVVGTTRTGQGTNTQAFGYLD